MNFSELEKIMSAKGVNALAEIARVLNTTPQAVSNWKARNQVPYHVITKLSKLTPVNNSQASPGAYSLSTNFREEDSISLSDILLTMAEQLKVILLTTFVSVYLTFTYVQFFQQPQYFSRATVVLPENKTGNLGGLAGLATQFGVNVPTGAQVDLSSPSLFPELLSSRTFAELILDKEFYLDKYGKKLSLLAILTHGDEKSKVGKDRLIADAVNKLNNMLAFDQDPMSTISVLTVTSEEPTFSKELAEVVLIELEALSRYFRSETVREKNTFIENRIASVEGDLEESEQALKGFSERNRQISSPALMLEQERLKRDVEVQKGIYLTLRQQLELAKIEEVQEASVVQVLDRPSLAYSSSNKRLLFSVILSLVVGLGLGVLIGFIRSYLNNNDMEERKKVRRTKQFFKKKIKDLFKDRRVSGIVSGLMLLGLPLFLGAESSSPVYFGIYSSIQLIINIIYLIVFIFSSSLFIHI